MHFSYIYNSLKHFTMWLILHELQGKLFYYIRYFSVE